MDIIVFFYSVVVLFHATHAFVFEEGPNRLNMLADETVASFLKLCFKQCDDYKKYCKKRGILPNVCAPRVVECVSFCREFGHTKKSILRKLECLEQKRICDKYGHDADACAQDYKRCLRYQHKPTRPPGFTLPPHIGRCGQPDIQGVRVIGGKTAVRGSWPWQGLLMFHGRPFCGATLISPQWVVTAAHCVYQNEDKASMYSVKFGEQDRQTYEGTEVTVLVDQIIPHTKYEPIHFHNDIALLKLERPVVFNKYISTVCLPTSKILPGTKCYLTGWGLTRYPGEMTRYLQQGGLPVVSNEKCYEKNKHLVGTPLSEDMICGGSGGLSRQNGCHGDSGGPYVCEVNGLWEIHGSVSYGSPSCNSSEAYTVFSRTFYFLGWIKDNMARY